MVRECPLFRFERYICIEETMTSKRQRISPSSSTSTMQWECMPSFMGQLCVEWNGAETKNPLFPSAEECKASRCFSSLGRERRRLMDRDTVRHLGSFLDTPSLAAMSSLDPLTANILRNQLELSTKSDELSDRLIKGESVYQTLDTLKNPKTPQEAIIARRAIYNLAREVASKYKQQLPMPRATWLMESQFLIEYIKREFPQLFSDTIKGLMGPSAYGFGRVASLMGDQVTDRKWLYSLGESGLSRVLDGWFPEMLGNVPRTIQLIRNLPPRGFLYSKKPFYIARDLLKGSNKKMDVIRGEITRLLDRVETLTYPNAEIGAIALQISEGLADDSTRGQDELFAAMLRYLQRHDSIDNLERIYSIIKDSDQALSETRAVLNNYMASESAWNNLVLA